MAEQEFVITQTSIALQNDLNKIERMLEIRQLGHGLDYVYNTGTVNAHVKTEITAVTDPPFEICDDGGNVILRIDNDGYLYTKEFDNADYARRSAIYQIGAGLQLSDGVLSLSSEYADLVKIYSIGTGLALSPVGELSVTITGGVTDVRVDNISVVSDTVANITMPIRINEGEGAFEITDEAGNIAMQITSEGHIRTKEFDSSNIISNLDFQVVESLPVASASAPKVVYNLSNSCLYILSLDSTTTALLGNAILGQMVLGSA